MARPLRIEYAGAHYHVMSRGNEQRPIVRRRRQAKRFDESRPPVPAVRKRHLTRQNALLMANEALTPIVTPIVANV